MQRDAAIATLKVHEAELKELGVRRLYLFDSTARRDARENSDVDLFFDWDIIEAVDRINVVTGDMPRDTSEVNWQKQWLVKRGVENISEANRRLTDDQKCRQIEIPLRQVPGISIGLLQIS
jgi:hypothetical protein